MKIYLSIILSITFLLLFVNKVLSNLITNTVNVSNALCWDIPNPMNWFHRIQRSCPIVESSINRKRDNSDMFIISFSCSVKNEKPELCQKVKNAFSTAGQIITSSIKLQAPLLVNATLVNFCKEMGICRANGRLTLGGAGPASLIPVEKEKMIYPQSLLKQLSKGKHPEYTQYDINAQFNSEGNYWFEGDGQIEPNQSDFLFVILHELIHGLGFASGWDDYSEFTGIPNILTPIPLILQYSTGQIIFGGFTEFIFDKFMVILSDGTRVSNLTAELNKFSGIGTTYSSINDFSNSFISSPQYKIAQRMMDLVTTPKSLGMLPLDGTDVKNAFILETSIAPYLPKSSISHCDYKTYTGTSDFLMRFLQDPGFTLKASVNLGKNYVGGPIGPKLSGLLSLMGYQTQNLPNQYKPNPDEVGKMSTASTFNLNHHIFIKFLFVLIFGYRLSNDGLF